MANSISIIIADNEELYRDGLIMMLRQNRDFKIVAEAEDEKELIEKVVQHKVDIILMSIRTHEADGVAKIKELRAINPLTGLIALPNFYNEYFVTDMIEAGINGCVMKTARKNEITDAIKTVYQGKPYFCAETTARLTKAINNLNYSKNQQPPSFSERELKIIQFVYCEKTSKEMAQELFLSPRTVEALRLSVQEKLQVKSPVGLAIHAIQTGLFTKTSS